MTKQEAELTQKMIYEYLLDRKVIDDDFMNLIYLVHKIEFEKLL